MSVRTLVLAALLPLSACGGNSDPAELTEKGYQALSSGEYREARKSFDQALAALGADRSQPVWMRAKMGAIQARIPIEPARAKDEFLELATALPGQVTDKDFSLIAGRLGDSGKLNEAVAVLEVGMKAHQESPHLQALRDKLGDLARSSGSAEDQEALEGLGYVGGD